MLASILQIALASGRVTLCTLWFRGYIMPPSCSYLIQRLLPSPSPRPSLWSDFTLALLPQVFVDLSGSRGPSCLPPSPLHPSLMPAFFSPGNQALMHPQEVCVLKEAIPARQLLLTWFLGPWHSGRPGRGITGFQLGLSGFHTALQYTFCPGPQNSGCYMCTVQTGSTWGV